MDFEIFCNKHWYIIYDCGNRRFLPCYIVNLDITAVINLDSRGICNMNNKMVEYIKCKYA